MGLLSYFRPTPQGSAAVAKERLQIIVAHERSGHRYSPGWLPALKRELMDVVRKYVSIDQDHIKVHLDRKDNYEILELNIVLPEESNIRKEASSIREESSIRK
jgi:cell division topological specificity factor